MALLMLIVALFLDASVKLTVKGHMFQKNETWLVALQACDPHLAP